MRTAFINITNPNINRFLMNLDEAVELFVQKADASMIENFADSSHIGGVIE